MPLIESLLFITNYTRFDYWVLYSILQRLYTNAIFGVLNHTYTMCS